MTSEAQSVTEVTPSLSAPTFPAGRPRGAGSSRVGAVISQILLSLVALLFLVPIIWMVLSALKPSAEVFTVPPKLFGSEILFSNFVEAWNYLPFGRFILNTIWVAGVGTLITLVASATAGYAFARLTSSSRAACSSSTSARSSFPRRSSSSRCSWLCSSSAGSTRTRL